MHSLLAATSGDVTKAGKAIGLAMGVGLGALGAGIGIGNIFASMIQSVARQPELRGELQGIQWLGFALTEAVVFYGLLSSIQEADNARSEARRLLEEHRQLLGEARGEAEQIIAEARRTREAMEQRM